MFSFEPSGRCLLLPLGLFLSILVATFVCSAGGAETPILSFNEGSFQYGDLICYRTKDGNRTEIHLVRCGPDGMKTLFNKRVSGEARAPICLKDGVVVTEVGGKISKYGFDGRTIFSTPIADFDGASMFAAKFNDRFIIVQRTWFPQNVQIASYELVFVDVSGTKATIVGRVSTGQILKVVRVGSAVFGCGADMAQEIKVPEGVK